VRWRDICQGRVSLYIHGYNRWPAAHDQANCSPPFRRPGVSLLAFFLREYSNFFPQ
jgi:hypothetical protein